MHNWVLINKLTMETGYSDDAIRAKARRGVWTEGIHWRKAPDNRMVSCVRQVVQKGFW